MAQLILQWLAMNGKLKNLVVVQFMRLNVSADLQYFLKYQRRLCSNFSEGMDLLGRQEQASKEKKLPFSISLRMIPEEGVEPARGRFSELKRPGLVCFPS